MSEEGTTGATPESTAATPAAPPAADTSLFGGAPETAETPEVESVLSSEVAQPELTQEEMEEIEHEGKTAKVPKEFKDAFLRQQDYTRKTQEVAEARRAFEAQQAAFQQTAQLQQATFAENARMYANSQRLEQFRQLNWDAITQADPVQAMKLERQMRDLQAENQQIAQSISQKQQHLTFSQQQESARRAEEGQRELARDIKGWSPELQAKLGDTAKAFGYRPEELAQVSDPRAVKLLHEAYLYRQLMAKQTAKPPAAPLPKPVSKVGGSGATNTKAFSEKSVAELMEERAQRRQRR